MVLGLGFSLGWSLREISVFFIDLVDVALEEAQLIIGLGQRGRAPIDIWALTDELVILAFEV